MSLPTRFASLPAISRLVAAFGLAWVTVGTMNWLARAGYSATASLAASAAIVAAVTLVARVARRRGWPHRPGVRFVAAHLAAAVYGSLFIMLVTYAAQAISTGTSLRDVLVASDRQRAEFLLGLWLYSAAAGFGYLQELRSRAGAEPGVATVAARPAADPPSGAPYLRHVFVPTTGSVIPLDVEEVERIEAQADYVGVWCGGRRYLVHSTLKSMESQLDPSIFVKIHRSHIVNLDHVTRIERRAGRLCFQLQDGTEIRASRTGSRALRRRFAV